MAPKLQNSKTTRLIITNQTQTFTQNVHLVLNSKFTQNSLLIRFSNLHFGEFHSMIKRLETFF